MLLENVGMWGRARHSHLTQVLSVPALKHPAKLKSCSTALAHFLFLRCLLGPTLLTIGAYNARTIIFWSKEEGSFHAGYSSSVWCKMNHGGRMFVPGKKILTNHVQGSAPTITIHERRSKHTQPPPVTEGLEPRRDRMMRPALSRPPQKGRQHKR